MSGTAGRPLPLGATWDGEGTNFSLFSEHAELVELCLFDPDGRETRHPLVERTGFVWHRYLPGVGPGQRYGYRVHGPWAPERGHLFNPAKLLIDPYATSIEGPVRHGAGRTSAFAPEGLHADGEDDAAAIPRCVVIDPAFDWEDDRQPERPWAETVIYETHVRGFTARHPAVREDLRGTYAGLASEASVAHLTSLGITAVELLPVHQIADEEFLHPRGLVNYWGYSSIGYLAANARYAAAPAGGGDQVREFKGMVKALHRAAIEVILDVVYNHTAEGDVRGPSLSLRGIDNASYYRLDPSDPSRYLDSTGTGNSLDPTHPEVLRLIMDSLRYWVVDCHVDGFRFDLATTLGRGTDGGFDRRAAFFETVHQDPVLSRVKLIAEPWDVGPDGYQVGNFPVGWSEWNGRYRDEIRDFWRGRGSVAGFASALTGSSQLFGARGRGPSASINFVTAHDGFTLADLVSYESKHNEANLEDSRDGTDDNRSWNLGVEGASTDPALVELRERQQRNFLTTLLLSQGVPMLLGGDETGRTQGGNNNAWCQDNETSWLDWRLDEHREAQLAFTRRLIALRAREPVFRRTRFLADGDSRSGIPDAWWFRPDGRKLTGHDWQGPMQSLGVFLNGDPGGERSGTGEAAAGDSFLLLVNAGRDPVTFKLPPARFGRRWRRELETTAPDRAGEGFGAAAPFDLAALAIALLRREG